MQLNHLWASQVCNTVFVQMSHCTNPVQELINTTCFTSCLRCTWCITSSDYVIRCTFPDVWWFPQVEADDVLTKEEQMYLIINARNKCETSIKSRHKIAGEKLKNNSDWFTERCKEPFKAFVYFRESTPLVINLHL